MLGGDTQELQRGFGFLIIFRFRDMHGCTKTDVGLSRLLLVLVLFRFSRSYFRLLASRVSLIILRIAASGWWEGGHHGVWCARHWFISHGLGVPSCLDSTLGVYLVAGGILFGEVR